MAVTTATAGDRFMNPKLIVPGKPKSGYTAVLGDLVRRETAANDEWDRAASTETFSGIVVSINSSNGTLSIARLIPGSGSTITLEYTGTAPSLGDTVQASATIGKGTLGMTSRDTVQDADAAGVGKVIAVDSTATVKTVVVAFE